MKSPCTTSRLVATKVTVEPAGTRISLGVKDQMPATIRTSYRPGPTSTTPGWSKGAVVASCVTSTRPPSPPLLPRDVDPGAKGRHDKGGEHADRDGDARQDPGELVQVHCRRAFHRPSPPPELEVRVEPEPGEQQQGDQH